MILLTHRSLRPVAAPCKQQACKQQAQGSRHDQRSRVLSAARCERVVVVAGECVGWCGSPAGRVPGGAWCSGCRGGAHSVVTSVTAVRAVLSSTMALPVVYAASRAWTARLLTVRGWPRLVVWMRAVASSENRVSDRPA